MDLETLLSLPDEEFAQHINARQRRRLNRGLHGKCGILMERLLKAKKGELLVF